MAREKPAPYPGRCTPELTGSWPGWWPCRVGPPSGHPFPWDHDAALLRSAGVNGQYRRFHPGVPIPLLSPPSVI